MRIAVIGSGFCGTTAAYTLLTSGHSVTMLDIGDQSNSKSDSIERSKRYNRLKSPSSAYDLDEFLQLKHRTQNKPWFTSRGRFGFSTVWGGTWAEFSNLENQWSDAYATVDRICSLAKLKIIESNCDCFSDFHRKSTFYQNSKLPSSENTKVLIDGSLLNEEVASSRNIFYLCENFKNFEYLEGFFVKRIQESENGVMIKSSKEEIHFDKVILAAGPVATGAILLNSGFFQDSITFQDTRMTYIPFLKSGRGKHEMNSTSYFSQRSLKFVNENEQRQIHIQMYYHLENYAKQILPIYNKLTIKLFKIFSKYLGICLIYFDPNDSSGIKIDERMNISESPVRRKNYLYRYFLKLLSIIGSARVFPLPIWKTSSPGSSYHLGAATNKIWTGYGLLGSTSSIAIAGAFALPVLQPAPITKTAMAQTVLVTNELLNHQNLESN